MSDTMPKVTDAIHQRQDQLEKRMAQNESHMVAKLSNIKETMSALLQAFTQNQNDKQ